MRTSRRKQKHSLNRLYSFGFLMLIGSALGTVLAFCLKNSFIKNNQLSLTDKYYLKDFFILLFKQIKFPLAIWFSAFFKIGLVVIPFLLILKGIALSFSFFLLGFQLGLGGIIYTLIGLGLENFILIFTYIYLAEIGFKFIKAKDLKIKEYFICLVFSLFLVVLGIFIEIILNPLSISLLNSF